MINGIENWDDPEELGNNEQFKQLLLDFEVQNGRAARVFIERYLIAMVFMNSLKKDFKNDKEHYDSIFNNNPRVIQFMAAASILIANTVATVEVRTLSTPRASAFLATVFKVGLIVGMNADKGPQEDEKLPGAFNDWMEEYDFENPEIDDDKIED